MSVPESTLTDGDLEWLTLEDGEEILWAGTPDRRTMIPTLLVGIPLSLVLIGIPIIIGSYLQIQNTNYVITTQGVYAKKGILSRDVNRVDFEKIQNIAYNQGAIGASFGYGSVEISTAGSGGVEMKFNSIPEPQAVQELISSRLERRSGGGRDSDQSTDELLAEMVTELRAIRSHIERATSSPSSNSRSRSGSGSQSGQSSSSQSKSTNRRRKNE